MLSPIIGDNMMVIASHCLLLSSHGLLLPPIVSHNPITPCQAYLLNRCKPDPGYWMAARRHHSDPPVAAPDGLLLSCVGQAACPRVRGWHWGGHGGFNSVRDMCGFNRQRIGLWHVGLRLQKKSTGAQSGGGVEGPRRGERAPG